MKFIYFRFRKDRRNYLAVFLICLLVLSLGTVYIYRHTRSDGLKGNKPRLNYWNSARIKHL